jgi:DNA polymerase
LIAAVLRCASAASRRCGRVDLKSGAFHSWLPSGRKISYPGRGLSSSPAKHRVVPTAPVNSVPQRSGAYAGTWTENVVSGIARDLLAAAMLRVEAAGYPIVLHVHDEIVAEVPVGFGSTEEFTRLMTRKPAWALELPITASAWTGPRYFK